MDDHGYIAPDQLVSSMCDNISRLSPDQQREFLFGWVNRKNEQLFGLEPTTQTN